jgi:hypothetical protein
MVSKNINTFEISKDYQPKFANLKDASASVRALLPEMVGEEKRATYQLKLCWSLMLI